MCVTITIFHVPWSCALQKDFNTCFTLKFEAETMELETDEQDGGRQEPER